jgi:hypothetical protein
MTLAKTSSLKLESKLPLTSCNAKRRGTHLEGLFAEGFPVVDLSSNNGQSGVCQDMHNCNLKRWKIIPSVDVRSPLPVC